MDSVTKSGVRPRIAVDWDGTCVPFAWPDRPGEWLPGAVEALKRLDEVFEVVIHSCRVAAVEFDTDDVPRDPEIVAAEIAYIKAMLESIGLDHVEVWTRPYKPPAVAYVDDRAINFSEWERVIQKVFADRHPNSARFHELLEEAGEMHDRKQLDYGRGDDPFANVRATEDWGVEAWVGAMIRLSDKVKRLQSLSRKGYLANEAAKDSFMDIAVYALIAYVLFEEGEKP